MPRFPASLFNRAVSLSLEWGEAWQQPVTDRIRAELPELTLAEAEALDAQCRALQRFVWSRIHPDVPPAAIAEETLRAYPDLDDENLRRLLSQGEYYARK